METPTQEWWSAAEIADARLPDLPTTKRKVNQRAKDEGWDRQPGKIRRRKGKGGGLEYHYSLFPIRARLKATRTGQGLFVTSFRRLTSNQTKRDAEIARLMRKGDGG